MQRIITLDLEGVIIPEIWLMVAKKTGIKELELTTRDIAVYSELMAIRINALHAHNITISQILEVIADIDPLDGAVEFLNRIGKNCEVIILSDTFIEFFQPFREKLGNPVIFCNSLDIDTQGMIQSHVMRIQGANGKASAVKAFQSLNAKVAASGDSYNDLEMLQVANYGAWFLPPESIQKEYPNMPAFFDYEELAQHLLQALDL